MRRALTSSMMAGALLACGAPSPKARLEITVEAPSTEPLTVRDGSVLLGRTSHAGLLSTPATAGHRYELTAGCPPGYVSQIAEVTIPEADPAPLTRVTVHCEEKPSVAIILIAAQGGPELPVSVDGVETGSTNEEGFLHLRLERPAGTAFQVSVRGSDALSVDADTATQAFRLGPENELFVLETRAQPIRRQEIKAPARPRPRVPYRLR